MPPRRRCDTCHLWQKKCDNKRPTCGRCAQRQATCTYPPTDTWSFVNQNVYSSELSKRRRHHKPAAYAYLQGLPLMLRPTGVTADDQTHVMAATLQSTPLWTLEDRVINRFRARWALGRTCLGRPDSIFKLYELADRYSPLRHAIWAIAYADVAVLQRHEDLALDSLRAYHNTLRSMQVRLADTGLEDNTSDEMLATILAIDAYESLYVRPTGARSTHTFAITQLIRLRAKADSGVHDEALNRAAAPRILARQLICNLPCQNLCNLPCLSKEAGHCSILHTVTATFVNEACDALSSLEAEYDRGRGHSECPDQVKAMCDRLKDLLQRTNVAMRQRPDIPKLKLVPVEPTQARPWPLSLFRTMTMVATQVCIVRDWILYHMCCIRIFAALATIEEQNVVDVMHNNLTCTNIKESSTLQELRDSCNDLLDLVPVLSGALDGSGQLQWSGLNDVGILIVQYPLWLISSCRWASSAARDAANAFLRHIAAHRSIGYGRH